MGRPPNFLGIHRWSDWLDNGRCGRRCRVCTGTTRDVGMGRYRIGKGKTTLNNSFPSSDELRELLGVATDLSLQAAEVHLRRQTGHINFKSTPTDLVSQVDHNAEQVIVAGINKARPEDAIVGEEEALVSGSSGFRWVVDPLDGTVNYLYGFPSYSVSIAVEFDDVPIIGVVYDTAHDELYAAMIGHEATNNDQRIEVTSCSDLSTALLGTGFAYDATTRKRQGLVLAALLPQVRDIRRAGSCAVDLCSVAGGRLDAFYETGVQWWDVAAGIAIVRAAGGVAAYEPLAKRIVASGPVIWEQLRSAVNEAEIAAGSQYPCSSASI